MQQSKTAADMHVGNYYHFLLSSCTISKIFLVLIQEFQCNTLKLTICQIIFSVLNKKAWVSGSIGFPTYHSIMLIKFYSLVI